MMKCFSLHYEAEPEDSRVDGEVRGSGSWLMETILKLNAFSAAETKCPLGIPLPKKRKGRGRKCN